MEDELKKLVDSQRAAFDRYETDYEEVWAGVTQQLDQNRRSAWWGVMKVAASILLAVSVGWLLYMTDTQQPKVNEGGVALHQLSADLAETEHFYATQVDEKLKVIMANNQELGQEAHAGLSMLDSAYMELKLDLQDNADNEEVVNAMIENYRIKLALLEQILDEIQENKPGDDDQENASI